MIKAKAGKKDEIVSILLDASKLLSKVHGCKYYIISGNGSEPDMIWITELWSSRQDHDDSLEMPEIKELISQAAPLIEGPSEIQELEVIGGLGTD